MTDIQEVAVIIAQSIWDNLFAEERYIFLLNAGILKGKYRKLWKKDTIKYNWDNLQEENQEMIIEVVWRMLSFS